MKRLICYMLILMLAASSQAVITRVQSKSGNTGNAAANSLTLTLTGNATVGNTLCLAIATNAQITRALYGSHTDIPLASRLTGSQSAFLGCTRVQEASSTIVISSSSASISAIAVEYSGTLVAIDIPTEGNTNAGSTSNATVTLATTNYANELVIAAMTTQLATTTEQTAWLGSITNSFTSVVQTSTQRNTTADRELAFLERIVTSTGAYQTTGTQTSAVWANLIGTFTDNPTPTPTATATPTSTPTPTATATASATATATATPTPSATAIQTSHSFGG